MSVFLASLVLNEMEFLPALYEQHKDWPGLAGWVFVEAADVEYQRANPDMVSADGLSVDGTTEFLRELAARDSRVTYIPHGFSRHADPAVGKAEARQRYMEVAERLRPEFVIAVDADEFYTKVDQQRFVDCMRRAKGHDAFVFPRREIWRPPSIANKPLFELEAVGGFWSLACCHWWRWQPGMHYSDCHNAPNGADGRPLNLRAVRFLGDPRAPQMIHLGYAAQAKTRAAKNAYYSLRGEDVDPKRSWYVESRAAWETWKPGGTLPNGAKVRGYRGPIPEVFRA